ncbi:MAG TPA: hypothetical protein VNU21_10390 [Usitatibacter sp.]|jgi:hypothetical protein|nr:hypothetical protein [Usitatibacter sp.]
MSLSREKGAARRAGAVKLVASIAMAAAVSATPAFAAPPTATPADAAATAMPIMVVPRAIAWAEGQSTTVLAHGRALTPAQVALARSVGVGHAETVRILVVDQFPLPDDELVRAAALRIGLAKPTIAGLTLGHAVMVRRGFENDARLLSHELRHVAQYEAAGGIPAFLGQHLRDLHRYGYEDSPFEVDARAHEREGPL